jgi:hypothetical protein
MDEIWNTGGVTVKGKIDILGGKNCRIAILSTDEPHTDTAVSG